MEDVNNHTILLFVDFVLTSLTHQIKFRIYQTGKSKAISLGRLEQVFGELSTMKYNKCTGTVDIRQSLEDSKAPDEFSD